MDRHRHAGAEPSPQQLRRFRRPVAGWLLDDRGDAAAQAFVAIYADRARARRLEPKIRQNVKAFGGSVERRRNVTIAWVRRPHGTALAAARRCLFA